MVQVSHRFGGTIGRYEVARIIARVFPAYKAFFAGVSESFDMPQSEFPSGPYPADALTYKSNRVVEYRTPAHSDGLGTYWSVKENESPIDGVAMLIGDDPDLLLLSVRLPPGQDRLASAIIGHLEREAARRPSGSF